MRGIGKEEEKHKRVEVLYSGYRQKKRNLYREAKVPRVESVSAWQRRILLLRAASVRSVETDKKITRANTQRGESAERTSEEIRIFRP